VRITLLRHGKPDFEWRRNVKGSEFRALEREYDSAGVAGNPPEEILGLAPRHNCIVCSDLPRSIQSAKALGIDSIHHSSAVFREMNLPYFDEVPIKLPLMYWVVLLRSLWFLGFAKNTESFSVAKARAKLAAEKLRELAKEHHSVLLIGHGFLNHYVAKDLISNNWMGPRNPGRAYWEYGTYEFVSS
jgi:broad specificity phosphatase PhoE